MGSNLLKQVSAERIQRPAGYYQLLALDALSVASAALTGFGLNRFLAAGGGAALAAGSMAFLTCAAFKALFDESLARRFGVSALETAAILSFFYDPAKIPLLLAAAAALALFPLWGYARSRSEAANELKLKFFRIIKPAGKKTVTALSLAAVLLFFPQWNETTAFIPAQYFEAVFGWTASAAKNFYPEIEFGGTVEALAKSIVRYQLSGSRNFKEFPPAMQKQALDQGAAQLESLVRGYLGVPVTGSDRVSDVFYRFLADTVKHWQEKFGIWFTLSWTIIAFLAIRSVGEVFRWLAAFLSFIIYQLLLALNVLWVRSESMAKESIEFSR